MSAESLTYRLQKKGNFANLALLAIALGLVGSVAAYFTNPEQFFHAFLVAFSFWTSIGLGAMFFTMLHHLTGASWSVTVRRIAEQIMMGLPIMFIFTIVLFLGLHSLYHWTHVDPATDAFLAVKQPYLNEPFFIGRTIFYFVVWSALAIVLNRMSRSMDTNPTARTFQRLKVVSAIGMLLFAFTITYAAWDWLMSLDFHWYSTIFGVYFFGGAFLNALAMITLLAMYLRKRSDLDKAISVEHFHDLGKLIFGFIVFWSYIGFSQFFLQWYGNIPEETVWYLNRWDGSWKIPSLILLFGHFMAPFVIMIFRASKRSFLVMKVMAFWLLFVHWVDMYWLAYPYFTKTLYKEGVLAKNGVLFSWIEPSLMILVGGVFLFVVWRQLSNNPLVPVGDPKLEASIRFVNH